VCSHHVGASGSGKSARRITFQIAETLPHGAKVPMSQRLFAFWRNRKWAMLPSWEKSIGRWVEIRRVKILLVDDRV
jgi:hypothetical protein